MASIRDVAKEAGVGVGTVSRFLNDSGYVSEDTSVKIEEAMKKLDYTPNELARNHCRACTECVKSIFRRICRLCGTGII